MLPIVLLGWFLQFAGVKNVIVDSNMLEEQI
jgi:hypothetical protein